MLTYSQLLRRRPAFRRIWLAEVVSLTGDWFTSIALFAMLLELTGRGEAVGLALVSRFLPGLVFGPVAGVLADRLPRNAIMIACDLSRAGVVLGFLLVRSAADVWLAYALSFLQMSFAVLFETSENAAIASVVEAEEMVAANSLQGSTWSAMLSLGALLGGFATAYVGRRSAFCIDSASYLLSAFFVSGAAIPRQARASKKSWSWLDALGISDAISGARYVLSEPKVRQVLWLKATWGVSGGGAILLYSIYGDRVFHLEKGAAIGIGALYAARGLGALLGPIAARSLGGDREEALMRAVRGSFLAMIVGYGLFAIAPSLLLAAASLVVVHAGASTVWTFSTALLNLRVPDAMRGRAFAADMALMTATMSLSAIGTGAALDRLHASPRVLVGALALLLTVAVVTLRGPEPQ